MFDFFGKQINNKKGFTLIELIIVIAILGILAALAVPKLTGVQTSAKDKVTQANEKMVNNLIAVYFADNAAYPLAGSEGDQFANLIDLFDTQEYLDDSTATELKKEAKWNGSLPTYNGGDETITMPVEAGEAGEAGE